MMLKLANVEFVAHAPVDRVLIPMNIQREYKKVSVVVPVFNEQNTLVNIIQEIEKSDVLGLEKEIILVDDASTDKTSEILKEYENIYKVLWQINNQGKGAAIKRGFENVTGDIVIIQDADLEYSPKEYRDLLLPIIEGRADVVFGSRLLTGRPHRVLYYWHYVFNQLLTRFSNMLTNINLSDMETCYKVFTRQILLEILPKLESKRFGFEPEFTARVSRLARKGKCKIYEIGISYDGRTYEEGKKIGWKDGIEAIYCIIKYNIFN